MPAQVDALKSINKEGREPQEDLTSQVIEEAHWAEWRQLPMTIKFFRELDALKNQVQNNAASFSVVPSYDSDGIRLHLVTAKTISDIISKYA